MQILTSNLGHNDDFIETSRQMGGMEPNELKNLDDSWILWHQQLADAGLAELILRWHEWGGNAAIGNLSRMTGIPGGLILCLPYEDFVTLSSALRHQLGANPEDDDLRRLYEKLENRWAHAYGKFLNDHLNDESDEGG